MWFLNQKKQKMGTKKNDEHSVTYIGETFSLHQSDGELYVDFEKEGKPHTLIFDITNLFRDLPHWISLIKKGNDDQQNWTNEQIKKEANGMV